MALAVQAAYLGNSVSEAHGDTAGRNTLRELAGGTRAGRSDGGGHPGERISPRGGSDSDPPHGQAGQVRTSREGPEVGRCRRSDRRLQAHRERRTGAFLDRLRRLRPRPPRDGRTATGRAFLHPRPELFLGHFGNKDRAALTWGPFVLAYDQSRNPGPATARRSWAWSWAYKPDLRLEPGPDLAFRAPVVGRGGRQPRPAIFVPFADAGADAAEHYRVWLRAPGIEPPKNLSLLADGDESRSGRATSTAPSSTATRAASWSPSMVAREGGLVRRHTRPRRSRIGRVVFSHGQSFHDGGWFDARSGKPRVQVQPARGGAWETVGELATIPPRPRPTPADSGAGSLRGCARPPGHGRRPARDRHAVERRQPEPGVLVVRRAGGVRRLRASQS